MPKIKSKKNKIKKTFMAPPPPAIKKKVRKGSVEEKVQVAIKEGKEAIEIFGVRGENKVLGLKAKKRKIEEVPLPSVAKAGKFKAHTSGNTERDDKMADVNNNVFKKRLGGIRKAMKKHQYGEQAVMKMYQGLLDSVLSLIPIAEENYRRYKVDRSAYALNTYINQVREIANDMRSVRDFEGQAASIVNIVRQQFSMIASNLIDENYKLKKELIGSVTPKRRARLEKLLDDMVKAHGRYLNESVKAVSAKVVDMFVDKPNSK